MCVGASVDSSKAQEVSPCIDTDHFMREDTCNTTRSLSYCDCLAIGDQLHQVAAVINSGVIVDVQHCHCQFMLPGQSPRGACMTPSRAEGLCHI